MNSVLRVHGVKGIAVGPIEDIWKGDKDKRRCYVRDITITGTDGETFVITVFADKPSGCVIEGTQPVEVASSLPPA